MSLVRQADLGISKFEIMDEEPDEKRIKMLEDVLEAIGKHLPPSNAAEKFGESAIEEIRQAKQLRFMHRSSDTESYAFRYSMESKGTQVLISLLIPALEALGRGGMFALDELDTSLHPNLSRAYVSLFSRRESNENSAQLVFSTHDVSLLSSGLLHHDEIWIAEKDEDGVSRFTPLTDYKLGSMDDVEKAYRRGRLGGISVSDDFFVQLERDEVIKKS